MHYIHSCCLGVIIDSKLSWQPQVDSICKSLSRKVKHLKRLRLLPKKVLETIYFSSIVPSATYYMTIWGTCSPTFYKLSNGFTQGQPESIHNLPDNLNSTEILENAHWQPFSNSHKWKLAALMYSVYYNLAPKPICDLFTRNTPHHSTRKSLNLNVRRFSYSIGRNSIRHRGSTLWWNTLPKSYQVIHKLEHLKEKLKKDTKLLGKSDLHKESCMLSNKNIDFYYF